MGGFAGHNISNFHLLFKYPQKNIIFISDSSIAFLMVQGSNKIYSPYKATINLLPFANPVKVKTKGLKWDMDGTILRFGHFVSCSNLMDQSEVEITSDENLLCILDKRL